jgi:hypothetical protein
VIRCGRSRFRHDGEKYDTRSTVVQTTGQQDEKSASIVLASFRSSTYRLRFSEVGNTGGVFRSPRFIARANGPTKCGRYLFRSSLAAALRTNFLSILPIFSYCPTHGPLNFHCAGIVFPQSVRVFVHSILISGGSYEPHSAICP